MVVTNSGERAFTTMTMSKYRLIGVMKQYWFYVDPTQVDSAFFWLL
jgi:hypothetical protein